MWTATLGSCEFEPRPVAIEVGALIIVHLIGEGKRLRTVPVLRGARSFSASGSGVREGGTLPRGLVSIYPDVMPPPGADVLETGPRNLKPPGEGRTIP
jgi:hypothetical protein